MKVERSARRAAYLRLSQSELLERVTLAEKLLRKCTLCPRECGVDRTSGDTGFCKTGDKPFVSSWGPHHGEERPLVGRFGSGTIFFGRCNLGCVFCQNYSISHQNEGEEISHEELAGMMLSLQRSGCHNINLVTPTHQMPMILRAVSIAAGMGLDVPIVYNCGGYESVMALKLLEGIIDIYMPDFKYSDPQMSSRYSNAADYPRVAEAALKEMYRQVGDLEMDAGGVALRGLLVRHLVMPEGISGTEGAVRFISEEISVNTYMNIMDQYHPCYRADEYPPLNRRITRREYSEAVQAAAKAGIKRIDGK